MSELLKPSRNITKICAACKFIIPEEKYGLLPAEVLCRCAPEGRQHGWRFSDDFDSFNHVAACPCTRCVDKREWRLTQRFKGIEDAASQRPATETGVWYLDGYMTRLSDGAEGRAKPAVAEPLPKSAQADALALDCVCSPKDMP